MLLPKLQVYIVFSRKYSLYIIYPGQYALKHVQSVNPPAGIFPPVSCLYRQNRQVSRSHQNRCGRRREQDTANQKKNPVPFPDPHRFKL